MQIALLTDGYCHGPLFQHGRVRRAPLRPPGSTTMPGILRRAAERRATPLWADSKAMRNAYRAAEELTLETGVTHSADHIVPLRSPWVCGLHVENNLCVLPLLDNVQKSNRHWPDEWEVQGELF